MPDDSRWSALGKNPPPDADSTDWFSKGLQMTMAEQYAEAIPLYAKALEAGQRVADSTALLAQALIAEGKCDEGLRISEVLIGQDLPEATLMTVACTRAHAFDQTNRVPEAIAEMERALPWMVNPARRAYMLGYLGNLYNQNRQFTEAKTVLEQALAINPGNAQALEELGRVQRNIERAKNAGDLPANSADEKQVGLEAKESLQGTQHSGSGNHAFGRDKLHVVVGNDRQLHTATTGLTNVKLADLNLRIVHGVDAPRWLAPELSFNFAGPVGAAAIQAVGEIKGKRYVLVQVWRSTEPPLSEEHCGEVFFCNRGTEGSPSVTPVVLAGKFTALTQSEKVAFSGKIMEALGLE